VIWSLVAVAVLVVAYIRYTNNRRDRLIDEANGLIADGDNTTQKLGFEVTRFYIGEIPKELVADRAKLEATAAKLNDSLAKIVADYRAAAAKFGEAKKASWGGVVGQYFDLMSQAYQNRADAEEAHRKTVALVVDKSIESKDELDKKRHALSDENIRFEGEFDRLEDEAARLRESNKGKFNEPAS
jgi:hypothetical protein